ncbi:MAG: hypothetical protein EOP51_08125 [Sphingobacteriales bacterium]|nr:MAG: hypothetical protein EOP51_08125 [Sphingobacteriales bacterium]
MEKTVDQKIENEGVILSEPAQWVDSASIMKLGKLVLTPQHLVFAIEGATIPAAAVDLDTINSISNEHLHTDPNILVIHYLQYDVVKFSVMDYAKWEKAIEDQRMSPNI